MFSNTLSFLSSRNVSDQVSHSQKTTIKIIVLYILIFKFYLYLYNYVMKIQHDCFKFCMHFAFLILGTEQLPAVTVFCLKLVYSVRAATDTDPICKNYEKIYTRCGVKMKEKKVKQSHYRPRQALRVPGV